MQTPTDEELHAAVRNAIAAVFGWRAEDVSPSLSVVVVDHLISLRRIADAVEEIATQHGQ